jgi:formylglycine-generating enzyme required for sulfatase activity
MNKANKVPGMVRIPGGEFRMGTSDREAPLDAKPVHPVRVDDFYLDEHPVTNRQFDAFVRQTGYQTTAEHLREEYGLSADRVGTWRELATPDRLEHPVVNVSRYDALAFAEFHGKRLPTEAEFERAARGGRDQETFPWGNASAEGRATWNRAHLAHGTEPVKSHAPNDFGVYDMAGGVWQLCADWYHPEFYQFGVYDNPRGASGGQFATRRGAAWNISEAFRMDCGNRGTFKPIQFAPNTGFRCAMNAE